MKKILHVENCSWSVFLFRQPHLKKLRAIGYEVVLLSPLDEYYGYLNDSIYTRHIPLKHLHNRSKNPIQDLRLVWELYQIYRREKPDLIVHFTVKPNIFGGLAARIARLPYMGVITGLGYSHLHNRGIFRVIPLLYKWAFLRIKKLVVYNHVDLNWLVSKELIDAKKCRLLLGSGVNTNHFRPLPNLHADRKFVFLFIGRLLKDKGLIEFAQAARRLREVLPDCEYWVVGSFNYTNPSAISRKQLLEWVEHKHIRYFGSTQDVRHFIKQAGALVLPSYGGEGVPRVILEAMAMGKPIITTESAGCTEAVVHNENGLVVPPRNEDSLLEAMHYLANLPSVEITRLGENSRLRAISVFDEKIIVHRYVQIIRETLGELHPVENQQPASELELAG